MSPAAERVIERLDAIRQQWWLFSLLAATALALCASLGMLLIFLSIDAILQLPQAALVGLFLTWVALSAAILAVVVRRLLGGPRSLEAAARRIETELPELGSRLINVVQLSEDQKNADRAFCRAAVDSEAAPIDPGDFNRVVRRHSRWRRLRDCTQTPRDLLESLAALVLVLCAAALGNLLIPTWGSAASRLLIPWEFQPSVGSVRILGVSPGDAHVLLGESLTISAEIDNPQNLPHRAALFISSDQTPESSLAMSADANLRMYRATVPSILKPFQYRLHIGDSQTRVFRVGVREKPIVAHAEAVFRYPEYLGRADDRRNLANLDLEAPQFTTAELRLRASAPIARGYLELDGVRIAGRVQDEGRLLVASLPMRKNGAYVVRLLDDAGRGAPNPRVNRVTVVPDRPPSVELVKPARQSTARPSAAVPVVVRASDDHGLGSLRLEMKIVGSESDESERPAEVLCEWTDMADRSITAAVRRFEMQLGPDKFKPGQTVLLRAAAVDRRSIRLEGIKLDPQETLGPWHAVQLVADEAQALAVVERFESLRDRLEKILQRQVRARVAADPLHKAEGEGTRADIVADVRIQQVEIHKDALDVAQSLEAAGEESLRRIRRTLGELAAGELSAAAARCDALLRMEPSDAFSATARELTALQDRAIEVLRKLLGAARRGQAAIASEMKQRPGDDLPDHVRKKLEDIRDKLKTFLEQQKKLIEAGENLAKTPVEDFTEPQEELLRGMAAAEDDWAKFLKDIHSDFSKLPEQDFSNPSMAEELIAIQVELKMAADALTKRTVEIAVPLEQLGYEMAEEMTTNLEKWLPDSPDREKWSQEESLTDQDKEAPMAELPGELEDMVGELMEEEESLFEEVEDISSSAADSLDKGAGWDAMDGPISNMSARGVTGNRLPNANEIGGRSGEGRQGKSSGEFVGDEAQGKGGRRVPTRLAPDPFVAGEIKDQSAQPAGGATGGGKRSGQGGEGLEGPQPRDPGPRDAQRLAGRQAQLRSKAEGVDLQFQVLNYPRTDLENMIERMAQVERDLAAGRYQNALRQRHVLLDGLKNVKQYVEGEFEVRQDATINLPAEIQKEILGGMKDPSPAGWDDLNRRYFDRLSGSKADMDGKTSPP